MWTNHPSSVPLRSAVLQEMNSLIRSCQLNGTQLESSIFKMVSLSSDFLQSDLEMIYTNDSLSIWISLLEGNFSVENHWALHRYPTELSNRLQQIFQSCVSGLSQHLDPRLVMILIQHHSVLMPASWASIVKDLLPMFLNVFQSRKSKWMETGVTLLHVLCNLYSDHPGFISGFVDLWKLIFVVVIQGTGKEGFFHSFTHELLMSVLLRVYLLDFNLMQSLISSSSYEAQFFSILQQMHVNFLEDGILGRLSSKVLFIQSLRSNAPQSHMNMMVSCCVDAAGLTVSYGFNHLLESIHPKGHLGYLYTQMWESDLVNKVDLIQFVKSHLPLACAGLINSLPLRFTQPVIVPSIGGALE